MKYIIWLISTGVILFSSCGVKRLQVIVNNPPQISLPGQISQIFIVNKVASGKASNVHLDSDFLYAGEARDGSNSIAEAIAQTFRHLNANDDLIRYLGNDENTQIESFSDMERYFNYEAGTRSTLVFVIDYFYANSTKSVSENSTDGAVSYEATRIAHYETRVYAYYFNSENILFSDIQAYNGMDDVVYTASGSSEKDAKQNLISAREAAESWGHNVGLDYSSWFVPSSYSYNRKFFIAGHAAFNQAYTEAKNGMLSKSSEILMSLTSNEIASVRSKAWYNLAVIAEMQGDRKKALECLKKSDLDAATIYRASLMSL